MGTGLIPFDENGDRGVRYAKETPIKKDLLFGVTFFHATIMMRKSAYDALNGYHVSKRTQRGQDLDLWYRFHAFGCTGYNLQIAMYKHYQTLTDYKQKRKLTYSLGSTLTMLNGFKLNHFPFYYYFWAFKPIVSALVPYQIMYLYHKKKLKKE